MDNSFLLSQLIWQYICLALFWTIMAIVSPTARRDLPKLKGELLQAFMVRAQDDGPWQWSRAVMRLPWIVLTWTSNVIMGDFQRLWTRHCEFRLIRAEAWAKIPRSKALEANIHSRAAEQELKRLRELSRARAMNDSLATESDTDERPLQGRKDLLREKDRETMSFLAMAKADLAVLKMGHVYDQIDLDLSAARAATLAMFEDPDMELLDFALARTRVRLLRQAILAILDDPNATESGRMVSRRRNAPCVN